MLFEGRWIEDVIQQRESERIARRAFSEAQAHVTSQRGATAVVTSYDDPATVVASLDEPGTFVVIGQVRMAQKSEEFVVVVRRSGDGRWSVEAAP